MIPLGDVCAALRGTDGPWSLQIGDPVEGGWIRGDDLRRPGAGPLHHLLAQIAVRSQAADDRRTVAAGFVLRYAWSSGVAIAACFLHRAIPDITLDNISLKFSAGTMFERLAMHDPRGIVRDVDEAALIRALRVQLVSQAESVVEALHAWSGFSRRGLWGQITSSWASQLIHVLERAGRAREAIDIAATLFAGDDVVAIMQPLLYPVSVYGVTQIQHRRASCCRYYLLPRGQLCASCPLVWQDARLVRNREWIRRTLRPPAD